VRLAFQAMAWGQDYHECLWEKKLERDEKLREGDSNRKHLKSRVLRGYRPPSERVVRQTRGGRVVRRKKKKHAYLLKSRNSGILLFSGCHSYDFWNLAIFCKADTREFLRTIRLRHLPGCIEKPAHRHGHLLERTSWKRAANCISPIWRIEVARQHFRRFAHFPMGGLHATAWDHLPGRLFRGNSKSSDRRSSQGNSAGVNFREPGGKRGEGEKENENSSLFTASRLGLLKYERRGKKKIPHEVFRGSPVKRTKVGAGLGRHMHVSQREIKKKVKNTCILLRHLLPMPFLFLSCNRRPQTPNAHTSASRSSLQRLANLDDPIIKDSALGTYRGILKIGGSKPAQTL